MVGENWFTRITVFEFLIILLVATTVCLVVKHYYDRRRIFKLGSKLPGPKPWPIIGNAWHFLGMEFDILTKLRRYQGKHKLLALWFGHDLNIFLYSPEFAEIFCQSSKLLDRSSKAKLFEAIAPNGAILSSGAKWKKARKLMESALHYSAIKNFIPIIESETDILIQRLRGEVGNPKFPLVPYLKPLLFDIISGLTIEYKEKAQRSEIQLLNEVDQILDLIANRIYNPLYHSELIYKLLPEGKKFYSLLDSAIAYANKVIIDKINESKEEKKKQINNGNSKKAKNQIFWEVLMNDKTLSVSDMRDHIFTMLSGAYETTSTATAGVLLMLALHPDTQEKAYQEIISIIPRHGNGDVKSNCGQIFNDGKLQQLKYLEMVIKETLRLFPTIPTTFRKATEDVQMGDYLIPAGADVSVNIFELHRDPKQYENPHKFNPDNFLSENIEKRHSYSFIPFASGQRNCVAYKLAMVMIKVIVAKFLFNYKVECDYKNMEEIKFRGDFTIKFEDQVFIKLFQRNDGEYQHGN